MKAKVNIPKRGNSNPPLKNLPPSALLEEQTKKMEQRLKELKDVMADQAAKRETLGSGSGTRWQSANQNMPIKNYAETVLKSKPKDTPKGSTLVKPPSRDKPSREKVPPLANTTGPIVTTPLGGTANLSQKNKENESQKDFFKSTVTSTSTTMPGSANKTMPKPQKAQVEDQKTAENNINRALSKQKETNEVDKFLDEIGLSQYSERFKENGFDDLETLMDAQTKHFVDMKIPAGHQIKLSKRIEQLKQTTRPAEKIILPNQKVDTKPANQINIDQVKASKTEYVQLDEPTKEQGIGDDRAEGGELLKGAYNEAESHKSFQEALNEWRSGKPATQQQQQQLPGSAGGSRKNRPKDSREKKVRFAEPADEKGKDDSDETEYISSKAVPKKKEAPKVEKQDDKKSFFFSGGSSWNQVEVPAQKETSTNMSPREAQVSQKAKVSCWHCYRLVNDDEIKNCGKKQFCSDECVKNYRDLNTAQCLKKGCGNKFLKEEGIMREGRWYCSEKCAPSIEEILMEEQRLLKKIEKEERGESRGSQGSGRSGQREEDSGEEDKPIEIDLSVDVSNKKQVLTLAELEEKYKNLNKLAEKAGEGENEFEDSLN